MMGWAMLLLLAVLAGALLWLVGFPRRLWTIAATALTLGAAGYAWQGEPGLPGRNVTVEEKTGEVDPNLVAMREAMFGRFNFTWGMYAQSDAMTRGGKPGLAVQAMLNGTRMSPQDAGIWTGLGLAFVEHDGGLVSPAARLAFERGIALSPQHPGPPFFLGMALARSGQLAEARPFLAKAVELTPENIAYREVLVGQLARLDATLAEQAGQPASQPSAP